MLSISSNKRVWLILGGILSISIILIAFLKFYLVSKEQSEHYEWIAGETKFSLYYKYHNYPMGGENVELFVEPTGEYKFYEKRYDVILEEKYGIFSNEEMEEIVDYVMNEYKAFKYGDKVSFIDETSGDQSASYLEVNYNGKIAIREVHGNLRVFYRLMEYM